MWGIFLETLAKIVTLIGPLIAPHEWVSTTWSFFGGGGTQAIDEEMHARVVCEAAAIGILAIVQFVSTSLSEEDRRRFASTYMKVLEREIDDQRGMPALGSDLRLNVMFLRWPAWCRTLKWYANLGFVPNSGPHHDAHLTLYSWQGLCGAAIREKDALFVDLRTTSPAAPTWRFWNNPFKLFAWQLRRTNRVKAILSVPVYTRRGTEQNPKFRIVGVINLDAVSDGGADWLAANLQQMKEWLGGHGTVIATLR